MTAAPFRERIEQWFADRGWTAFPFQREVWDAVQAGESGLLHATTGAGKTFAVWLGALAAYAGQDDAVPSARVLWITPMRALAADTARALAEPLEALGSSWTVGMRTGDTAGAERSRQARRLPSALVTTPESLTLFLAQKNGQERFADLRMVVVDEWHELIGSKRGVQVQLALARLQRWNPDLVVWGLSATLGNLEEARTVLVGDRRNRLVQGRLDKRLEIDTLIPASMERFPWAGHLGLNLVSRVAEEVERSGPTLLFANVRSQVEQWYQALLEAKPDWAGLIAVHHGSLDRDLRDWVERGLKAGTLKAVVCTSSLDLGVDFLPVERVLQLGSPKGVARLLQRAGRSGHAPGRTSRVTCVPTHALELLEAAAARRAARAGRIESRHPPRKPLDVLAQHLVTIALGDGFMAADLLAEVRSTHSYRDLEDTEWAWALAFVVNGGSSLYAYPEYHRVVCDAEGLHTVPDARIAKRHRMSIGTIVADSAMEVRWLGAGRIGTIEESFIGRLKKGDCFLFAGRALELVRVHEMTAYVRRAPARSAVVPRWDGGKSPLSTELAEATAALVHECRAGTASEPETRALEPLLELQARWSRIPGPGELLMERIRTREGHHLFCYPFGGRAAHIGLASLMAWRVARLAPATFSISVNDYGFELLTPQPVDWDQAIAHGLFALNDLEADVLASLNASELARRRFREIARIAGLVFQGFPGQPKTTRQLQASSGLFFDVFDRYDPDNLLLAQARREVLEQELEIGRLRTVLERVNQGTIHTIEVARPTPFAFPLLVGRIRERLTAETLADRVARMLRELETAAGQGDPRHTQSNDLQRSRGKSPARRRRASDV